MNEEVPRFFASTEETGLDEWIGYGTKKMFLGSRQNPSRTWTRFYVCAQVMIYVPSLYVRLRFPREYEVLTREYSSTHSRGIVHDE